MIQNSKLYETGHKAVQIALALAIAFLLGLAAGGNANAQTAGNVYGTYEAQSNGMAAEGVVVQVRLVAVEAESSTKAIGASAGAALGGAVAYGASSGRYTGALSVLGAALGGLAGNHIASGMSQRMAQEIVVDKGPSFPPGQRVSVVVQPAPYDALAVGQRVLVIQTGAKVRVVQTSAQLNPSAPINQATMPTRMPML